MERYKNLSGSSGVNAFELGESSNIVEFRDGRQYLYTDARTAHENVRRMQELARRGSGDLHQPLRADRYERRLH